METQSGYEVCKRVVEIWKCRLLGLSETCINCFNSSYHCWDWFVVVCILKRNRIYMENNKMREWPDLGTNVD